MFQVVGIGCLFLLLMPILTPVFAWQIDGIWAGMGVIALEGAIALASQKKKNSLLAFLVLIFLVVSCYYGYNILNYSAYY
ncbi:MAG: hypothetical protein PHI85_00960 [Victivallaceae bacterium]|nr:hypothetical protein [Victivallaceae bacterium]